VLAVATISAVMLGMRLPKSLERQLVEGDVGEATVGRHITGALMHLDHGIGRLVLGA
jgi:hypothetical protein